MAKHVYKVPTEGDGVPGSPVQSAYADEHDADPGNYNRHYRREGGRYVVYVAADVRIPTLEAADDVEVVDPEETDVLEYHTPSELAEQRGVDLPDTTEEDTDVEPAEDEEE